MVSETIIRVRYAETDKLGIVYHSNFFPWFEEGRTDYMERLGFSYALLEAEGLFLPLTECRCEFLSGAKYADRLTIRTRIERIRGIRITMGYEVVRAADGALLARGATTHAFVDRSFRPINIARVKPALWQAMQSQLSE